MKVFANLMEPYGTGEQKEKNPMAQKYDIVTQNDVKELMDAADLAWRNLRPSRRVARFLWRGKKYIATHSQFRLIAKTPDGKPIAYSLD